MILYKQGNILDSESHIICNTINCVGVMGAGVAKDFKAKYPEYFTWYKSECVKGNIRPGNCYCYPYIEHHIPCTLSFEKIILSLSTKDHWKNPSKYEWVESCLNQLNERCGLFTSISKTDKIALPLLGCGNGQLDKTKVKTLISNILTNNCIFEIWERNN